MTIHLFLTQHLLLISSFFGIIFRMYNAFEWYELVSYKGTSIFIVLICLLVDLRSIWCSVCFRRLLSHEAESQEEKTIAGQIRGVNYRHHEVRGQVTKSGLTTAGQRDCFWPELVAAELWVELQNPSEEEAR